ncbi:FlgD immunoglobulin-like domain containing protein [Candidatus Zixiibacteriota bacterium]
MTKTTLMALLAILILFSWTAASRAQDFAFTYTSDNHGDVIHPDSLGLFVTVLTNTGAQPDSYRVVLDKQMPVPWQALACLPTLCFFDSASLVLNPAQLETITVDIMPIGFGGAGAVNMKVRSLKGTGQTEILPLTAVTNTGVDVLVIDDDGTEDYETYYQAALDSAGRSHGTFDNATTKVYAALLAPFPAVVWFTGEAAPVLTEEDRQAISGYLNGGGRLFISGQDIAYALNDSSSGESDASTVDWFGDTFLTEYISNDSENLVLEGLDGHAIADGLTISISGGDGANNQVSPDIVYPFGGIEWIPLPEPLFIYAGTWEPGACLLNQFHVGYRIVYFAFGFEAIDNAADRALLMERILNYFEGPSPVESETDLALHPRDFYLSPNYPNPFNATTAFALYIPEQNNSTVSLKIYNVLGQEVRVLLEGPISPGSHLVQWDGRDDAGHDLASGVYFSRLVAGDHGQTRKLILTR